MGLVVLAVLSLGIDAQAARFFAQRADGPRVPPPLGALFKVVNLAETFGYGGTVLLLVLLAARLDRSGLRSLARLAAGPFGAGLAANGIKLLIARTRPKVALLEAGAIETFAGWLPVLDADLRRHAHQSFPSAHTATAFGLATVLAWRYPQGAAFFYLFAALAGLQRVQSLDHFPSDVLCGAALGVLVGTVCASRALAGRWFDRLEGNGPPPALPSELHTA